MLRRRGCGAGLCPGRGEKCSQERYQMLPSSELWVPLYPAHHLGDPGLRQGAGSTHPAVTVQCLFRLPSQECGILVPAGCLSFPLVGFSGGVICFLCVLAGSLHLHEREVDVLSTFGW